MYKGWGVVGVGGVGSPPVPVKGGCKLGPEWVKVQKNHRKFFLRGVVGWGVPGRPK